MKKYEEEYDSEDNFSEDDADEEEAEDENRARRKAEMDG